MTTDEDLWDFCIVGAGPAGLAVASELAASPGRICLVEGGADGDDGPHGFPPVRLGAEDPYPNGDVDTSHSAGLGGTARQWSFELRAAGQADDVVEQGCRYAPMQPLDLIARPGIGTPGWPIDRSDLDTWGEAAHALCGLGPYRYDAEHWSDAQSRPLPLDGTGVTTSMFQFGPASAFTGRARDDLVRRGVHFLTDTTALWLEPAPEATSVHGVRVAGADGTTRTIRARQVVLAAGGLETVRLLLDTGRRHGRTPGDHAGLVGRNFMEHPLVRGGLLATRAGDRWLSRLGLYGTRQVDGTYVSAKLTLVDEVVEKKELLACSALLVPRDAAYAGAGSQALARLRSPSGRREPLARKALDGLTVLAGAPSVARAVLAGRHQPSIDRADWAGGAANPRYSVFEVLHQTEQSPDPDNRLTLGQTTDALGRSELLLTWRWSLADQRRIGRSRDLFAQAFAERGIGRMINTDWDDGRPRLLGGTHHHLGTTRMSAEPDAGVVDPDCRVHHWENVHVVSGSVFPSAGFVNPTLTVVALALRLGRHLRA